jgi:DNA polymerase III epsilon subunit-like protein
MNEIYISVDVETAGPNPANYALLSIGAVKVGGPERSFYIELKPDRDAQTEEAAGVHGLSLAALAQSGAEPADAMQRFADWLRETCGAREPIFVAFNAPFDWMFVNDYFHRYLGRNPFGHRALDIKALFMGLHGVAWGDTSFIQVSAHYGRADGLPHHALEDARLGAELFAAMLTDLKA